MKPARSWRISTLALRLGGKLPTGWDYRDDVLTERIKEDVVKTGRFVQGNPSFELYKVRQRYLRSDQRGRSDMLAKVREATAKTLREAKKAEEEEEAEGAGAAWGTPNKQGHHQNQ